jgi:uncharacterized membrane protein YiaA
MVNMILFFTAGLLTVIWGVAHLFPTKSVVNGFGDISTDNRYIITMEWIIEGIALIFIGVLISGVTLIGTEGPVATFVYILSISGLILMAIVSLLTGFKIPFLPFKLCPFIFTLSALIILTGMLI